MKAVVATLIAAGLGLAAGWLMTRESTQQSRVYETNSLDRSSAGELSADVRELNSEIRAALQPVKNAMEVQAQRYDDLAAEVAELRAQIEGLDSSRLSPTARVNGPAIEQDSESTALERRLEALVEAGLAQGTAEEIVAAEDAVSIQRLNLRYRATREGWFNSTEYREQVNALRNERDIVLNTYGEDTYDRYLYATGRPNRVVISGLLTNSPARQAGLKPGDRVVEFNNEPVYNSGDLMRIATSGEPGEPTPILLERQGELLEFYLPRGPLGVHSRPQLVKPDP